jgi:hypothetical protein
MERKIRKENELEMEKNIHYKEKYIKIIIFLHASTLVMHLNSVTNLNSKYQILQTKQENRNNKRKKERKRESAHGPKPSLSVHFPFIIAHGPLSVTGSH